MGTILYRAKRKDNGEWIEGYYAKTKDYLTEKDIHVIFPEGVVRYPHGEFDEHYEIIPETLCRLLERHPCWDSDHSGIRFFQNDIVAVYPRYNTEGEPLNIALVVDEHSLGERDGYRWFPQDTTSVRIIGNAYDNPELLKDHLMRRFINGLGDYCGEDYIERHRYLTSTYDIHGAHAGCYLCNFENDYICNQYNGGCPRRDVCERIRNEEAIKKCTDAGDVKD